MITERAVVTRCEAGRVEVRLQRDSACGHCELSQGCVRSNCRTLGITVDELFDLLDEI